MSTSPNPPPAAAPADKVAAPELDDNPRRQKILVCGDRRCVQLRRSCLLWSGLGPELRGVLAQGPADGQTSALAACRLQRSY